MKTNIINTAFKHLKIGRASGLAYSLLALYELMPYAICIINTETFKVVNANHVFLNFLGYTLEEMKEHPFPLYMAEKGRQKTLDKVERMIRTGEISMAFKNTYISKDGKEIDLEWTATIVDNEFLCTVELTTEK